MEEELFASWLCLLPKLSGRPRDCSLAGSSPGCSLTSAKMTPLQHKPQARQITSGVEPLRVLLWAALNVHRLRPLKLQGNSASRHLPQVAEQSGGPRHGT